MLIVELRSVDIADLTFVPACFLFQLDHTGALVLNSPVATRSRGGVSTDGYTVPTRPGQD